ncbi:hypothetical protein NFI96_018287 [Prochilodus magdalenae]|nr:hypothetical protein NFI96_018287 [Prochilodus magdalenae]
MRTPLAIFPLVGVLGFAFGLVREYIFIDDQVTWMIAQNYCRSNYRDLSTVITPEEKALAVKTAGQFSQGWIGLYRPKADQSKLIWSDEGAIFDWRYGELGWNHRNCYLVTSGAVYNTENCWNKRPFFCMRILVLVKENKTWVEAYEYCRANFTGLAFLSSQAQLDLAKKETNETQTVSVWTGLRFLAGEWLWVNGEPLGNLVSLHSCPAQPYRCGARNSEIDVWENRDCEEKLNFLCYWFTELRHITTEMKTPGVVFSLVVVLGLTVGLVREHIFFNSEMTWSEAQQFCRQHYRDLSTVIVQQGNTLLIQIGDSYLPDSWIGLHRSTEDSNNWIWSDDDGDNISSLDFNWKYGYPYGDGLHCVMMDYASRFDNRYCNNEYPFLCERILVMVKENKTWEEAYEYCKAHYTGLAFLSSQTQLDLAKEETNDTQTVRVWTGLRFLAGEWLWVNGEPLGNLVSLPSCPAQPYRCGARNSKMDIWENRDCEEKLNFLCYE